MFARRRGFSEAGFFAKVQIEGECWVWVGARVVDAVTKPPIPVSLAPRFYAGPAREEVP